MTCNTQGVVYLLQCPCKAFIVGKTRREFWRRIYDHTYATSVGYFKSPIGRHIALDHNYKFDGFSCLPLCIILRHMQGGNWDQRILQAETRWIFHLNACTPPGLNDALSFGPFLQAIFWDPLICPCLGFLFTLSHFSCFILYLLLPLFFCIPPRWMYIL